MPSSGPSPERPWDQLPRAKLIERPTPLHPLPRFSEWLGAEVWIKRDDYAPLTLAGNKVRKLEYLLPGIVEEGCDVLVTVGAAQSNAARCTAVIAAQSGLDCALLLLGDPPDDADRTGNLLIDTLVGAELHYTGATGWQGLADASEAFIERLESEGKRPRLLPLGYSTALGVVAFAAAFAELADQCRDASLEAKAVVHASTSGATHAGLILGRSLLESPIRVVGVDAARVYGEDTESTLESLIGQGAAELRLPKPAGASTDLRFDFIGPGYGEVTPEAMEAMRMLGGLEGVLVDPVYSSKALAGMVGMARSGELSGPLVFWHTGGVPALFAPRYRKLIT